MSNCRTRPKVRRPTAAQRLAFAKLVQRNGEANLTKMELILLSNHPQLTVSQREGFAAKAARM